MVRDVTIKRNDFYFGIDGDMITNPKLFCDLKGVFLTKKDILKYRCDEKQCRYRVVKHKWNQSHFKRNFKFMNKKEANLYGRK